MARSYLPCGTVNPGSVQHTVMISEHRHRGVPTGRWRRSGAAAEAIQAASEVTESKLRHRSLIYEIVRSRDQGSEQRSKKKSKKPV